MSKEAGLNLVRKRVEDFEENIKKYKSKGHGETNIRTNFIDPLFQALGWDMINHKEVVREFSQRDRSKAGNTKKVDYAFKINGKLKFFIEAKEASVDLENDRDAIFQAKRYAYSSNGKAPIVILTDFEEFRVFNVINAPKKELPNKELISELSFKYTDYLNHWDELWKHFSREAVEAGSIEALRGVIPKNIKTMDIDFLEQITLWREKLARNIAIRNEDLFVEDINESVQRILDRLVFIRNLEDREIEPEDSLFSILKQPEPILVNLVPLFRELDATYNGLLFKQHFSEKLLIDDKILKDIIKQMCYPISPFKFDIIEPEILGRIYEKFLGSKIRLTDSHRAKVEQKPEVRHAGGVYYTPEYIVDQILEQTVKKRIKGLSPEEISKIKIIDPSCGSGSFLLGAYELLITTHKIFYEKNKSKRKYQNDWYIDKHGEIKLSIIKRGEILKNNIYGVDLDNEATEVAIMSLYLKMLDDGFDAGQRELFFQTGGILPDMGFNIKPGNSIIGADYFEGQFDFNIGELKKIKPFDWNSTNGFNKIIEAGGFDCVIGNPPYIDSEEMSKTQPETRRYCSSKNFQTAAGNWDMYCVFSELALSLLKDDGYFGFIIPNKFISAPYGDSLKQLFSSFDIQNIFDYSSVAVFISERKKVNVYPFVLTIHKSDNKYNTKYTKYFENKSQILKEFTKEFVLGKGELDWSSRFSRYENLLNKIVGNAILLKTLAKIENAATTAEAYEIKTFLCEESSIADNTNFFKFINTGTIDRYVSLRSIKDTKYIKNTYTSPIIETEKLQSNFPNRYSQAISEKLIFAGMVLRLEGYYDTGETLAGKSTVIVKNNETNTDLRFLLGILNSKLLSFVYRTQNSQNAMSGGYVNVRKNHLESLPIPKIDTKNGTEAKNIIIKIASELQITLTKFYSSKSNSEKKHLKNKIDILENQIDNIVYQLFKLTSDEIALVERLIE